MELGDISRFQKKETKRGSERGELLQFLLEGVNAERDGKKYKKLRIAFVAARTAKMSLRDLYYLKSICIEGARKGSFSKVFWGSTKIKDPNDF